MAIIRKKELHEMSESEVKEKISELQREFMSEKAKLASGGMPDNAGKMREIRKTIARLKTVAGERGYNLNE